MSRIHDIFAERSRSFVSAPDVSDEYYEIDGLPRPYPRYSEIKRIADNLLDWIDSYYLWGSACKVPKYVIGQIGDVEFAYVADELGLSFCEWHMDDSYLTLKIRWWKYE